MTQVPVITIEQAEILFPLPLVEPSLKRANELIDKHNKAIEIALAEQATQDQFISAEEAKALGAWRVQFRHDDESSWTIAGSQHIYSGSNKYRAIHKEVPAEPHAELKENLIKLDGVLITREAAVEIWESKKDTCDVWFKTVNGGWIITHSCSFLWTHEDGEYQLRPKAKNPVIWLDMPMGVAVVEKKNPTTAVIVVSKIASQALVVNKERTEYWFKFYSEITLAPADQQPWINWRGGDCPVPEGVIVEVTLRNKVVLNNQDAALSWEYDARKVAIEREIISYRVVGIADGWGLK